MSFGIYVPDSQGSNLTVLILVEYICLLCINRLVLLEQPVEVHNVYKFLNHMWVRNDSDCEGPVYNLCV